MNDEQIKSAFEGLTPTCEQTEKMYREIMRERKTHRRIVRKGLPKLALIAAIICIVAVSSVLAASYNLESGFLNFLKPSPQQAEYLANGACVVDKKVVRRSGTLEIKQVLGDEQLVYILMDFTAPKGTVLDAARYQFEPNSSDFDMKGQNSSYGWGFTVINDGNPYDNKISLIMRINSEQTTEGRKMSLVLADLQAADEFPGEFKTVIKGKWKTSFTLNFKNTSVTHNIGKPIELYGQTATLETISVSPISINFHITGNAVDAIIKNGDKANEDFDKVPVTLMFKDGSSFTTTDENSVLFAIGHSGNDYTSTKGFQQVIDSSQVKSVVIFGQEFALG